MRTKTLTGIQLISKIRKSGLLRKRKASDLDIELLGDHNSSWAINAEKRINPQAITIFWGKDRHNQHEINTSEIQRRKHTLIKITDINKKSKNDIIAQIFIAGFNSIQRYINKQVQDFIKDFNIINKETFRTDSQENLLDKIKNIQNSLCHLEALLKISPSRSQTRLKQNQNEQDQEHILSNESVGNSKKKDISVRDRINSTLNKKKGNIVLEAFKQYYKSITDDINIEAQTYVFSEDIFGASKWLTHLENVSKEFKKALTVERLQFIVKAEIEFWEDIFKKIKSRQTIDSIESAKEHGAYKSW